MIENVGSATTFGTTSTNCVTVGSDSIDDCNVDAGCAIAAVVNWNCKASGIRAVPGRRKERETYQSFPMRERKADKSRIAL